MELRHLRYFLTAAEFQHFGRAAEQLRIAQPSLSHQILQLESELQTKLFERSKKRVRLTEAGRLFVEEARQILEHVDRAALIARTGKGRGVQQLRVGFGYWTDLTKICATLQRFAQPYPEVRVQLSGMASTDQITALREGRIDIGLVRPPVTDSSLHSEFLLAEHFVLAVAKNHSLAARKRVTVPSLKEEPIIMPLRQKMPAFYDLALKLFYDAGVMPKVHVEVDYPAMVLCLVASGIGISLVPASISRLFPVGIRFVPLQPSSSILETALAWRRNGTSAALSAFLQAARDVNASAESR